MSNILIFSRHFGLAKRKAGFNHLADKLKLNNDITFITVDFSYLSKLANDYRNSIDRKYINSIIFENGLTCYLRKTIWHPLGINRFFDFFTAPFVYLYSTIFFNKDVVELTKSAEVILIESSNAVLFLKKIKATNKDAKIVYRVSDLVKELTHIHSTTVKADNKVNDYCDEITIGTSYIYNYHKYRINSEKIFLDCHGIDKTLFDTCKLSPYPDDKNNKVVFVGASKVDIEGLNKIAFYNPDYEFFYFGPLQGLGNYNNIHFYGETKFSEIVPYIKYANYGLQFIKHKSIKEYGDSLKVLQYTYCNLPIIAPKGIITERENFTFFDQNDYSTLKGIFNKIEPIKKDMSVDIDDWQTVANRIINRVK